MALLYFRCEVHLNQALIIPHVPFSLKYPIIFLSPFCQPCASPFSRLRDNISFENPPPSLLARLLLPVLRLGSTITPPVRVFPFRGLCWSFAEERVLSTFSSYQVFPSFSNLECRGSTFAPFSHGAARLRGWGLAPSSFLADCLAM